MKNQISVLFSLTVFLGLVLQVEAQQATLEDKLQGKHTLEAIMQVVDQHYGEIDRGVIQRTNEPKYTHWARWAWYISGRLGPRGEFVDIPQRLQSAKEELATAFGARTSVGNWGWLGPYSTSGSGIGRVDRIAFHPTDPNIIYAGCPSGGLWKTTNGGSVWFAMTDFLPSIGIGGIVVSHASPNIVYILTGDGDTSLGGFVSAHGYTRRSAGVFKSYDSGTTWYATGDIPASGAYYGYDLIQNPGSPNILLAATSDGLYKTVNAGYSWYEVLPGRISDVKFKPGSSSRVYAAEWGGNIHYSADGGESWTATVFYPALSSQAERIELDVTPNSTDAVWALIGPATGSGVFEGLYLSLNQGQTFVEVLGTPNILGGATDGSDSKDQAWYDHAMAVSPTNAIHVITGGIRIWRTTSSPASMVYVGGTHVDIHDLAFNPIDNKLYAGTDGGIYVSTNLGDSWTFLSDGLISTQIYHMTATPLDANRMMIGTQDNGTKLRESNTSMFKHVYGGDGYDARFDPGSSGSGLFTLNKATLRFWNSGNSVDNISPADEWFPTVEVHQSNANIKFAGYSDVYRSDNNGASWANKGASGSWALQTCPSDHNRIYAAGGASYSTTTGEVYRSDDLGNNWVTISDNPGFPSGNLKVTDIGVYPGNADIVWVTIGGFSAGNKVFYSYNGGDTWTNLSANLPNIPINCIDISDLNMAYIGTDLGVFYRYVIWSGWMPFNSGLPNVPVTDLCINQGVNKIRAATFGRGVWESNLYSNCPTTAILTQDIWGRKQYEVSEYILTTSDIKRGENSEVTFKAGNFIWFGQGFSVTAGARLRAYLAACAAEGIPEE